MPRPGGRNERPDVGVPVPVASREPARSRFRGDAGGREDAHLESSGGRVASGWSRDDHPFPQARGFVGSHRSDTRWPNGWSKTDRLAFVLAFRSSFRGATRSFPARSARLTCVRCPGPREWTGQVGHGPYVESVKEANAVEDWQLFGRSPESGAAMDSWQDCVISRMDGTA